MEYLNTKIAITQGRLIIKICFNHLLVKFNKIKNVSCSLNLAPRGKNMF